MKQSSRYNDIVSEITTLNSTIIHDMYTSINSYTPILLMVSEAIGTLDLLCSFAYFTSLQKDSYTVQNLQRGYYNAITTPHSRRQQF